MKPVSSGEWVEVAQRSLVAYSERTGTPVEDIDLPTALSSSELEVVQDQPGIVLEAQLGLLYNKASEAKDAFVRGVTALGIAAGSLAGRAFALKLPQDAVNTLSAWFNVETASAHAAPKLSPREVNKLIDDVASLDTPERPKIPEGTEFETLFNLENLDVVYGRSDRRLDYLGRIVRSKPMSEFMSEHWVTIDQYNNQTMLKLDEFESAEHILGNVDEVVKDHPKAKAYWDELKQHPRFSPVTVFSTEESKLAREGGEGMSVFAAIEPKDYNEHMLAIRRACKFGVEYVVNFTSGQVHFALDGVTDEQVVRKEPISPGWMMPEHYPITSTELRSIYRNWDKVKHRVIFYRNGGTVKPPWESNPGLWKEYKTHRENKYEASAHAASSALVVKANQLHESGKVSEAALTECMFHLMNRVEELINRGRYRDAISLMEKSAELIENLENEGSQV
jgi:hypothetical protein